MYFFVHICLFSIMLSRKNENFPGYVCISRVWHSACLRPKSLCVESTKKISAICRIQKHFSLGLS